MRKRHVIAVGLDNSPTPERLAKNSFTPGKPPRVRSTMAAMLNSGDITQEAANAGERWYRDWVFAYHGVIEFPEGYQSSSETKHDEISWRMTRAKALEKIADVRDALGLCSEQRLKAMLVDEMNWTQMGAVFFPRSARPDAITRMKSQCAILLEQLAEHYAGQRRREAVVAKMEKKGLPVSTVCA